ncbi:hypothetical protein B296_00028757 [Ensete ventricosum]|uniref:Uncharacterized protein n=1 Tax=Ensete ventricosum TaxID=4639 RepID=A0A426ZUQ9_ENSVE|nr:hypothetical protein B296_00028757 [Ensete ventricosum]
MYIIYHAIRTQAAHNFMNPWIWIDIRAYSKVGPTHPRSEQGPLRGCFRHLNCESREEDNPHADEIYRLAMLYALADLITRRVAVSRRTSPLIRIRRPEISRAYKLTKRPLKLRIIPAGDRVHRRSSAEIDATAAAYPDAKLLIYP